MEMANDSNLKNRRLRTDVAGDRPDISVCIVNWNTREYLARCLSSLYATADGLDLEVIVVDNASSDGSADMAAMSFPQVTLLRNWENRGFAAASNQALRVSSGRYLLLLNPDMQPCPRAMQDLQTFMDGHPEAGAATGKLVTCDGSRGYPCRRGGLFLDWLTVADRLTWNVARPLLVRAHAGFEDTVAEADVLVGGCMMLRPEVVDQVGGLDEDFFVWYEDFD